MLVWQCLEVQSSLSIPMTDGPTATTKSFFFLTMKDLLLLSPPGQLDNVANELNVLSNKSSVLTEDIRSQYNQQTGADLLSTTTTTTQQEELLQELKAYQEKYYSSKGVEYGFSVSEGDDNDDDGTVLIRTFGQKLNATNCTAGSWYGQWTVRAGGTMNGTVQIHAYCYESANIQLQSQQEFSTSSSSSLSRSPQEIVQQVSTWEGQILSQLQQDVYDTMGDKLKSLRRVLPITRTRMEWNVLSHRMVQTLATTNKSG